MHIETSGKSEIENLSFVSYDDDWNYIQFSMNPPVNDNKKNAKLISKVLEKEYPGIMIGEVTSDGPGIYQMNIISVHTLAELQAFGVPVSDEGGAHRNCGCG